MYDIDKLIQLINELKINFKSQNEFARIAKVNAGYISKIINKRTEVPPSPDILKNLASTSIKSDDYYFKLMDACGYLDNSMQLHSQLNADNVLQNTSNEILERKKQILNDYMSKYNISELKVIPIYGVIKAGTPSWAEENIEGYIPFDSNIQGFSNSDDFFYLRVNGESMNQVIKNGDYALIQKTESIKDGDIIVALVNGYDATLKKYKRISEQYISLEPMSNDPNIESITVDLKTTSFKILGKFVGYFGKYKK